MTFLSVYTPTYRRPRLLEQCKASVAAQTEPVEHVIVEDTVGLGVGGMYLDIRNHAHKVTGDYVMVLSDDNVLADDEFAADLHRLADEAGDAEVVVFCGQIGQTLQPAVWRDTPQVTKIDLSCFAVQRLVWQAHSDAWGDRYEGDYDFIRTLWDAGCRFYWWRRLGFRALQIGRGEPE